MKKMIMFY